MSRRWEECLETSEANQLQETCSILRRIVIEHWTLGFVHPNAILDLFDLGLGPQFGQDRERLANMLLHAPRIGIFLRKLLGKRGPRDDRFTSCGIAAYVKPEYEILNGGGSVDLLP